MDAEDPTHAGIRTLKPFTGYKMCVSLFGKQASLVYNHQNKNIRLQIVSGVERDRGRGRGKVAAVYKVSSDER